MKGASLEKLPSRKTVPIILVMMKGKMNFCGVYFVLVDDLA